MNKETEPKWTDKDMIEFAKRCYASTLENGHLVLESTLASFKAGSPSGRDWEIVRMVSSMVTPDVYFDLLPNGKFVSTKWPGEEFDLKEHLLENKIGKKYSIHSVKNLTTGEIFSVGDELIHVDGSYKTKIVDFVIPQTPNSMWFHFEEDKTHVRDLKNFRKASPTSIEPEQTIKPPIGIMPEWLWKDQRKNELRQAIKHCLDLKIHIPIDWIAEEYSLTSWLEMYHEDQQANQKINNPS